MLLHADGGTASTDITRQREKLLHGDEVALLVARKLGRLLQIDFVFTRDDTDKVATLIAMEHQGLEDTVDVLAQTGCYMYGTQIVFVHLVGDQLVVHLGFVE